MTKPLIPLEKAVIAVLASFGNDAGVLASVVEQTGASVRVCSTPKELCEAFDDSIAAVIITEESLAGATDTIMECLDKQAVWSDVPLLILTGGRGRQGLPERWQYFRRFGNVTVLDRPLSKEALKIAIEAACRARAWQFVVRDQMQKLEAQAADLEAQVNQRTKQLLVETRERKHIEDILNETRRIEAIGRLAGGVAHDFNNLLQVISGAAQLLPYMGEDEEQTENLINTIMHATERGSTLTQQLLAFGRRQKLASDTFDVAKHLLNLKELLQQSLREKIVLDVSLQAGLWHARADATQLEVALLNLTLNAKHVLPNGGRVTLSARNVRLPDAQIPEVDSLQGDFVCVSVSDDGPGMPPEVAAKAFEPFFTTKGIGEGSGLGLSQVYGFAKQSSGEAWIRTGESGTEVSILLPRSDQGLPAEQERMRRATDSPERLKGLRVLYVEDDEAVARIVMVQLKTFGCAATWVHNADRALEAELSDYDLVFSDVQMPGSVDGIGLAEVISRRRPDMPVLLNSGYIIAPERLQGLEVKVLNKPYSSQELQFALLSCL